MNTLPNIAIINVGDPNEVDKAMKEIVKVEGPVYIRIGRLDESEPFYTEQDTFQTGRILNVCEGTNAAVLSTGIMTGVCKKALQKLREDGISLALYHIPTLKPVNTKAINLILQDFKIIYTVEDHNIFGGLGSLINDTAIKSNTGNRIINIGIRDRFGKCGSLRDLFVYFGLSEDDICRRVKSTLFNDHRDI
ncbi:MAG: hypothetical protein AMS17_20045 [Spirochaetes bacterium DG_61]|nr:MAG: hypothetical protein AMS17_20045 [Spirochaetes bacterium DG_61]